MLDRVRELCVWGFVALLIGGMWVYADARRTIDTARQYWPPAAGSRKVRWREPASPSAADDAPWTEQVSQTDAGEASP